MKNKTKEQIGMVLLTAIAATVAGQAHTEPLRMLGLFGASYGGSQLGRYSRNAWDCYQANKQMGNTRLESLIKAREEADRRGVLQVWRPKVLLKRKVSC